MGRWLEARQTKASRSGQGTAKLALRKLLQHVRLNFRYGQVGIHSPAALIKFLVTTAAIFAANGVLDGREHRRG